MDGDDELMATVYRKIEREKALINAATNMRQSTNNPLVQQRVDANIRDGRKNIAYLEGRESGGQPGSPTTQRRSGPDYGGGPPQPPPKDGSFMPHGPGDYDNGGYNQGPPGSMPLRAPFHDARPDAGTPKARPNFSKLGKQPNFYSAWKKDFWLTVWVLL
jgi:hypothetical protein